MPDVATTSGYLASSALKVWPTNPLERLNAEIMRRTRVVDLFPHDSAIAGLVRA